MDVAHRTPSFVWRTAFCRASSANTFIPSRALTKHGPFLNRRSITLPNRRNVLRSCLSDDSSMRIPARGEKVVITTPLFYVNAPPHMGSAYPAIAADALTQFYRMAGASPIFITGCDEHGEKIAGAAAAANGTETCSMSDVQKFCDKTASQFDSLWGKLSIRYDCFVRTTNPQHAKVVKQFMERVWANGDIYKSVYDGLYCTGCEEYKVESDLVDGNVCPTHLKPCSSRKEENYFFALSKYQGRLETFLESNPHFVVPAERRNEVLGWVKSGLRDFSVSRANNQWGIPIPQDESQTIYVWFDALLGYVSALLSHTDDPNLEDAEKSGWPADLHIIGKDILRFHAVYWPAMLMSAGMPLPRRVVGHGFITKDGLKMGKSLGNTLDPGQLVDTYGSDAVRYYFLRAVDFGRDGDFSEQRFVDIVNADLANSLGNLLNRSLNLLKKNCGGVLPMSSGDLTPFSVDAEEGLLRNMAEKAAVDAFACYHGLDFVGACESIMSISLEANAYIDRVAPWTMFKSDNAADVEKARRCIVNILEAVRIVAAGLSPVTPLLSQRVYEVLGFGQRFADGLEWKEEMQWGALTSGMSFAKPKPVFPRLELSEATAAVVA